jgi:hypothetical protein
MNMQDGLAGHAARTSRFTFQRHAAWTCRTTSDAERQNMQHGHSAGTCMDMKALTCSLDMRQVHEPWTCSKDMQHGHAEWISNVDMQQRQATWTFNRDMQLYAA